MTSGGCEILHADCIEVLQTLAENSFDALITDPPYSSGGQYRGDRMQSVTEKYSQSGAKAEYLKHAFEGDNMDQHAWTSWTAYWLELCRKAVKPGGVAAIFIDWRQLPALYDAIQWGGWVVRGLIPWDKKNARPQPHRPKQQCEFIVWASNGPLDVKRDAEYMPGLLQGLPPSAQVRTHQTEKPLDVMRQLVHICENGGRIIDPFAGSGTTICAAYLEGFGGLGIERNKVAEAARRFGRGELDTRVEVPKSCGEEIVDLANAFNTMADSLEKSEQRRQEFVANVSHELKTPMTTIGGYIDGMLDGTIPPEKQQHYMQIVSGEVRRLSRLVRNMLDIAKLQAMGVEDSRKTRFDLGEELSDVLITFEQKIYNKHLDVRVDLPDKPVWTRAERDSITQVIYNLIENAIKFCPDGGRLSLRVQSDGGKARVSVENTGPTIDKDELPLLFDRFHKADKSRSADREGWGLGLYIAKTIVGAHGGDIWATSENGVTQFNFTLPAVR